MVGIHARIKIKICRYNMTCYNVVRVPTTIIALSWSRHHNAHIMINPLPADADDYNDTALVPAGHFPHQTIRHFVVTIRVIVVACKQAHCKNNKISSGSSSGGGGVVKSSTLDSCCCPERRWDARTTYHPARRTITQKKCATKFVRRILLLLCRRRRSGTGAGPVVYYV